MADVPDAALQPIASEPPSPAAARRPWTRWVLAGCVALVIGILWRQLGGQLSLQSLAAREDELRSLLNSRPVLVLALAWLLYVAVTGLSLPGAAALTMLYGWCFQLVTGVVVVSFASTAGASLAFLLSRYLLRDAVRQRFGERLAGFERSLEREGPFYLFTLRLIPAAPFFVVNLAMGLTPLRLRTFWWISQLGMLPGTIVYVYVGSVIPSLRVLADQGASAVLSRSQLLQISGAFALLGLFPWFVRSLLRRFRPVQESSS
jgi:uncharacterized membrane protein YdjX (TVP38/TMEM64 family)